MTPRFPWRRTPDQQAARSQDATVPDAVLIDNAGAPDDGEDRVGNGDGSSSAPEPSAQTMSAPQSDADYDGDYDAPNEHSAADAGVDQESAILAGNREQRPSRTTRVVVFAVLPVMVMLAAGAAGFLKWQAYVHDEARAAAVESVKVATDVTIKMLSYRPDTVEKDLGAAGESMTGSFRDDYAKLTHDVVIPGARQKNISALANVPGAAPISAAANHAVVLVLVNQTTVIGTDPPINMASSVKVTLDKQHGQWLVSAFDPI